ncbi:MAG: O-antigen ligase domain-containing protein, partial [Alphaproteobacteria bacterium]|nr:O-antigen ligase domain-containing protein [Alphaproteobacteria bacterium]
FGGEYFLTGKGFGINLADDDGFQVRDDASLLSPHNVHLTVLARTGVPGFALWVALQLAYAGSLIVALFHARSCGHREWQALFLLLFTYWLAMLVNASFDPYLEGPMGGIWFWSVMGVGLAACHAYRYRREVLA